MVGFTFAREARETNCRTLFRIVLALLCHRKAGTFVNSTESSDELDAVGGGRLFECSLEIDGLKREPFELDTLPDSFRYDRNVEAFGVNCGIGVSDSVIRTSDAPTRSRLRPDCESAIHMPRK